MATITDKIYCTKCGREIKNGLLYCDRCGQSVRKSRERQAPKTSNRAEAERIHREQMERKKQRREKELKREKNRRRAIRRARVLAAFIAVLVLAAICFAVTFFSTDTSGFKSNTDAINEDIAKNSPAATESITSSSSSGTISTDFTRFEYNGMSCPYPTNFKKQSASGKELLRLTDAAGGAVMSISKDSVTASGSAASVVQEMMFAYYDEAAQLDPNPENRCGSDWYVVTYTSGGMTHHRKCVISGTSALCYDFEYENSSASAADYANCIAKLDENFTSVSSTQQ